MQHQRITNFTTHIDAACRAFESQDDYLRHAGYRLPKLAGEDKTAPPCSVVRLPVEAARRKACDVINAPAENGYTAVVNNWMQAADGLIQFSVCWIRVEGQLYMRSEKARRTPNSFLAL